MPSEKTLERIMPQSLEAERVILGAIMLDPKLVNEAAECVRPEDLYLDAHRRIYQAMLDLNAANKPVDIIHLADVLTRKRELESIGGVAYVASLIDGVPHQESLQSWNEIVLESARARFLISMSNRTISKLLDLADTTEIVAEVEADIIKVLSRGRREAESNMEVAQRIFRNLMGIRDGKRRAMGLSTGIEDIDELTTGYKRGEYHILAGRTGQGKSSLKLQSMLVNAKQGHKVLDCTLEMSHENQVERLIAMESRVDYSDIRDPRWLNEIEMEKIAAAGKFIGELPILIDDVSGIESSELCARIKMHIMKSKVELVFVDYLQNVRCRRYDKAYDRVTAASGDLRDLAKTTGIPVVALSQLSRAEKGNENKRPQISDLKESGNIENDAFSVGMIYRPKHQGGGWNGEDEYIIGKQRNGPTGYAAVQFNGPTLTFRKRVEMAEEPSLKRDEPKQQSLGLKSGRDRQVGNDN